MTLKEMHSEWREEYSCIDRWLNRVSGYESNIRYLYNFMAWLKVHVPDDGVNRFEGLEVDEVLSVQRGLGGQKRYEIVDFLQDYVIEQYGSVSLKKTIDAVVRSFFKHNRAELPRDGFRYKGDYDTPPMDMRLEDFRAILREADVLYRSVFLTKFQGMMGNEEIVWFSNNSWPMVERQMRRGSLYLKSMDRVIVHFPGRKGVTRPYWTSLERDALEPLNYYLRKRRGQIRPGEPIYVNSAGNPLNQKNIVYMWTKCCVRAGVIEPWTPSCHECDGPMVRKRKKSKGVETLYYVCLDCGARRTPTEEDRIQGSRVRYGKGSHEGCRDLTRSRWCKSEAKEWVAEFRMGHPVDPNNYKKIMKKDPQWGERQFEIAAPWLNILSEDPEKIPVREHRKLQKEIVELRRTVKDAEWLLSDPEVTRILRGMVEERRRERPFV